MNRKIDHDALIDILSQEDAYGSIVQDLVEQYLGVRESTLNVPIPGGAVNTITEAGIQFLVDAEVLVDEDPE